MAQFEAREIGARLALARREAGLNQEELSDLANISKRSLQDYEAGVTIPYKHMTTFSKLLDKPVEWFLRGAQDETVSQNQLGVLSEEIATLRGLVEELLRRASAITPRGPLHLSRDSAFCERKSSRPGAA